MPSQTTITLEAPAKLNLALAVGPPLPAGPNQGFHPIASWFVAIDLCDTLSLTRLGEHEPSRYTIAWSPEAPRPTPIDWPLEKDLAVRAHRSLEARVGRSLPVALRMDKRIPVGGGLGGGSSDAASMLLALDRLFDLRTPIADLITIASTLGSDIAFFLDERCQSSPNAAPLPAIVTGLGERVERTHHAPTHLSAWLIVPPFGCPTGPVYKAFDAAPTTSVDEARVRALAGERALDPLGLFNDLERPACVVEPRLASTLAHLRGVLKGHAPVHVTGSGSTMFAMCPSADRDRVTRALDSARDDRVIVPIRFGFST